jgi:D-sedoheptulose 7-phosphate isomerase
VCAVSVKDKEAFLSQSDQIKNAESYFSVLSRSLSALPWATIDRIASILYGAYKNGKTIFLFGNGGSASLASHFACDLSKGTVIPGSEGKRVRAIALTDNIPSLTAWANDSCYDDIFSEPLRNLVQSGDIAFGISCSGNSRNVLKALKVACEHGATTVGLGGFQGGKMKELCDDFLIVPSENMQIIEDLHLCATHCLFTLVRNRIFADHARTAVAARVS